LSFELARGGPQGNPSRALAVRRGGATTGSERKNTDLPLGQRSRVYIHWANP